MGDSVRFRIGALAEASDLTVRTLHHWDSIGLLVPSERTGAGHRIYTGEDVARLYRILALREVGLDLPTIAACLEEGAPLDQVVEEHAARVDRSIDSLTALRRELERVRAELAGTSGPSTATLVDAIRATESRRPGREEALRRHLTPAQFEALSSPVDVPAGPAAPYLVEVEWPQLYARAEACRRAGATPSDSEVQAIVARMDELAALVGRGDAEAGKGIRSAWREDPAAMSGLDPAATAGWADVADFVEAARVVARKELA